MSFIYCITEYIEKFLTTGEMGEKRNFAGASVHPELGLIMTGGEDHTPGSPMYVQYLQAH